MQVQGVQQIVFAYGGAMIFTEFMAEMRRPRDFWKAAFAGEYIHGHKETNEQLVPSSRPLVLQTWFLFANAP